ncbi:DUF484 family protein [Pseudoruegeria sp. SK021]|uniref:DUF484 family protein n=1 Tax=Pseudoruegeria sp. SK021 TaxID=1933035 RepID=UPI000A24EF07|nr:DUF484 family protein [Pseudoruegeria sp. SK021]OSP55192.1 hypothetical protein BV911_09195 [Pseudoruegeria sp. SK021]
MSSPSVASVPETLRSQILADPDLILQDTQIIKALLGAEDSARGRKVVDLRGAAISRLETRLDQLENTHQNVISAAYDNVSTTSQVHRAILTMIAPMEFDAFLETLGTAVPDCLRIRAVRLVLEAEDSQPDMTLNPVSGTLSLLPAGFVHGFVTEGRRARSNPVILRRIAQGSALVYGTAAADIRSEAVVRLDLGPKRAPGLLVLGADKPEHFAPGQATDLLELFCRVCERLVRSWLK